MSKRLAELCSVLVAANFGDLAGKIFSTLADHGRLTLNMVRNRSRLPLRRLKQGLAVLVQHHMIFYYAEDEYEPTFFSVDWHAAYSLLRTRQYLDIITERQGETAGQLVAKILQLGHAKVQDLAQICDPDAASKRDSGIEIAEEDNPLTNGDVAYDDEDEDDDDAPEEELKLTVLQLHQTLRNLLKEGILVKVNARTYLSPEELEMQIKETVKDEKFPDGRITGSKKSKLFQEEVKSLKRKYQEEDEFSTVHDVGTNGDMRHANTAASSNKRIKTSHQTNGVMPHNGDDVTSTDVPDSSKDRLPFDMVVRVNYDKCTIILRDQRFIQLANQCLGPPAGAAFAALLRATEGQVRPRGDPSKGPVLADEGEDENEEEGDDVEEDAEDLWGGMETATDDEVAAHLEKFIDQAAVDKYMDMIENLANGEPAPDEGLEGKEVETANGTTEGQEDNEAPNGATKSKPVQASKAATQSKDREVEPPIKEEVEPDDEDDPVAAGVKAMRARKRRLLFVKTQLDILAEDPRPFCIRSPSGRRTRPDFPSLAKHVILTELDNITHTMCGKNAVRMSRLIRTYEKIDEERIADALMLPLKPSQAILTAVQFQGLLECQELPKDNQRQPRTSVFLWWFDIEAFRSNQLEKMYQGMTRALQRVRVEGETRFKAALEKAARMGVKLDGTCDEEQLELLPSPADKDALKKWMATEEALWTQVERLDALVGVFRDFSGDDTTLQT